MKRFLVFAVLAFIASVSAGHRGDELSLRESDEITRLKARVSQLEQEVQQLRAELQRRGMLFSMPQGPAEPLSLSVHPKPLVRLDEAPVQLGAGEPLQLPAQVRFASPDSFPKFEFT